MFLTAHHVRSPLGHEGINAFHYIHGGYVWMGLPPAGIPDQEPGELTAQRIAVAPGGNQVLSYLDIVAPDETRWPEIQAAFMTFLGQSQRQPFPRLGVVGRCYFRLGMDQVAARAWQREAAELYRAARATYVRVQ